MDPQAIHLLARLAAVELLIESVYTVALLQTRDPVGEARAWIGEVRALAARSAALDTGGAASELSRAVAAGMVRELDTIFSRVVQRIENHARNHPTAGRA